MQLLKGRGKIYGPDKTFLGEVDYEINYRLPDSGMKWLGEITPVNGIMPVGEYILELQDGCRGPCSVCIKTTSSFGLVVDSFNVEGIGPLTS